MPRAPLLAALLVAGALVSGATALQGIQPNDEGLMLQAAARIADGQVPYADFWWFYPPGQPYLLAALQEVFGPSLLVWRVVRALTDAVVAALAFALARRAAGPGLALAAWGAAILAMAYPSGPHPFPIALALALGALLAFERRPAIAGVLVGACAAWRIEFAAFAALGIVLAGAARGWGAAGLWRFGAAATATAAALFAPVVIASGAQPAWDLLVDYPLTDFRDYQTLPFPLGYDGPLNTSSLGGFVQHSVEPLLLFYLPLVLVAGLAGALATVLRPLTPRVIATGVFSVGALAYLLVRPDAFHTAPLAVMVAVLAAWALGEPPRPPTAPGGLPRTPHALLRGVPAVVAGVALAYAIVEGLDRRSLVAREDTVALDLPVAHGVRVPPADAAQLKGVVARIQRAVAPGEPIYVATRRSDLVTSGHPLLYVLAQRENPTRYDVPAPGVVTTAPVQRAMAIDIEHRRTPLVVRWTDPVTVTREPNAAGRSTGVRVLDRYLGRRFRPAGRVGSFQLLERRPP